jgi:hypothetical protein
MEPKDRTTGGYETMVSDKEDVVLDTNKQSVGEGAKEKIASTARTLRDQGADRIASSASTLLKQGERYLEGADISPVRADVERMIRQYPIPALVAGVLAGYLMAHRGALKALGFGLAVGYLVSRTRPR